MSLLIRIKMGLATFSLEVDVQMNEGVTALFGPSGAGKTSIVNVIAGLMRPDHGYVELNGCPLVNTDKGLFVPAHKRLIGYVFQDARLFPHMNVRNNLLYGARRRGVAYDTGRFAEITDLLDIGHLLQRKPALLSGGEKQRVAIGRALLSEPKLLLMDEPMASLDDARKSEILPYLELLPAALNVPIVYVSHAIGEVSRLATDLVLLERGQVVARGAPSDILSLANTYPRASIPGAGTLLSATVESHIADHGITRLHHDGGTLTIPLLDKPLGSDIKIWIAARDIAIAVGRVGRISIRNRISARIENLLPAAGTEWDVVLIAGRDRLVARLTRAAIDDLGLTTGMSVTALAKSVAVETYPLAPRRLVEPHRTDNDAGP